MRYKVTNQTNLKDGEFTFQIRKIINYLYKRQILNQIQIVLKACRIQIMIYIQGKRKRKFNKEKIVKLQQLLNKSVKKLLIKWIPI